MCDVRARGHARGFSRVHTRAHAPQLPGNIAAFGISGNLLGGLGHLFATHPPLEQRIDALRRSG